VPVITVLLAVCGVLAAARRRRAVVSTALAMAAGVNSAFGLTSQGFSQACSVPMARAGATGQRP
jgi:hypothetical protein